MPFSKLFRSRWSALLWAGGIIWTALDVSDSVPSLTGVAVDAASNSADPAEANELAIVNQFIAG